MRSIAGVVTLLGLWALGATGCGGTATDEERGRSLAVSARAVRAASADTCVAFQRGSGGDVADAKLSNRQPDKRFGDDPVASVSRVNGHQEHLLLRFDTGSIPRHATVTSATLSLWQTNGRPASLQAHAVTRPWDEATVTWNGFGSTVESGVVDVSSLVSTWVRRSASNHGLLLTQSEGKTVLDTSESPHLERRPRLEVCYSLPPVGTKPSGTSVLLQVVDGAGKPVPGAAVSSGNALFPTDGAGRLLLENLQPGRFLARVDALGFTSASAVVELSEGEHAGQQVRLLALGNPIPFQAGQGGVIETPGVRVTLPPNAVVDALGRPVMGTVEVTVAPLDPTTQLAAMPGPLEGVREATAGGRVPLESYFMAEVSLWSNGAPAQLAPGASATVEYLLPEALAAQLQPGATLPAWWFDLDAGLWRQEGTGTVQLSASQPGRKVWAVQVKHFTWWNADAPWTDKSCVDVLVVDSEGLPVANAQVLAEGVTYAGVSTAQTGSSGRACVEIKRGHTVKVFSGLATHPTSAPVEVTGTAEASICGTGPCTPITLVSKDILCAPGTYEACAYSGPAGTLGQGLCRAGQRYCDPTGTEWSACEGEVLPVAETCRSPFDDDCDGVVNEDCSCTDQQGVSCYTGPAGTQGVGLCRGGAVGCDLFGNAACVGQRLPRPEDCSTLGDDDCDGSTECQPVTQWFWRPPNLGCGSSYGGTTLLDLAMDGQGNLLVVGALDGSMELGGGSSLSGDHLDLFVAKLDASGRPLWGRVIDRQSGTRDSVRIAVDGEGNGVVAGLFSGGLTLGSLSLTGGGALSPFVVKLSPDGEPLWGRSFELSGWSGIRGLAVDAAGDIALAGSFSGTLRIGDGVHTHEPYWNAVYVAKLGAANGLPLWSKGLQSPNSLNGVDVTMDAAGNVLLAGAFNLSLEIDGTVLTTTAYGPDIFLAKLEAGTGLALWSRTNPQASTVDVFPRLRIDGAGNVLMVSLIPPGSFRLTKFDGTGQVLWSRIQDPGYGGLMNDQVLRLNLDASGNLLVSGGLTLFGRYSAAGAYLTWYDSEGGFLTDRSYRPAFGRYGPLGSASGAGAAIDPAGNLVLGGSFGGMMDFGSGPLQTCSSSPFVMKLDPTP